MATPYRLVLGLAVCCVYAQPAPDEPGCEVEEGCTASFLQTTRSLKASVAEKCGYLTNGIGDPTTFFNNNCKYHSRREDCMRPIQDVMAEHEIDGYCYFNATAMYIGYVPDEVSFAESAAAAILTLRGAASGPGETYRGESTGPEAVYNFEGKAISTHIDVSHYVYDDVYAYSLGFLQGQGIDATLMENSSAWEALSREKCDEIQAKYNFTREDMILNEVLDMNMPILAMSYCAANIELPSFLQVPYVTEKSNYTSKLDCSPVTSREFARHHYMKCLLGYRNSAMDMAYLVSRACLLDDGTNNLKIGHLSECPYEPQLAQLG
ncbi:unnamed protein product [Symbiodinium sp. CCMP2592]|nr:unnamed protein product [Symbiodinium sp. CCMP2592]